MSKKAKNKSETAELSPTKSKTKKVMTDLLNKAKSKTDTSYDENARIRTDEISQNAITGLFLVLKKGQWHQFPLTMKLLWVFCIMAGSGIQWITLMLLYIFLQELTESLFSLFPVKFFVIKCNFAV